MAPGASRKLKMNKSFLLLIMVTVLVGCAAPARDVRYVDIESIPDNDCMNKILYMSWLDRELSSPKHWIQKQEIYNDKTIELEKKYWSLVFNCNRV